jgi:hypothetical protein
LSEFQREKITELALNNNHSLTEFEIPRCNVIFYISHLNLYFLVLSRQEEKKDYTNQSEKKVLRQISLKYLLQDMFEDTKVVNRSRISKKDRPYNYQKKNHQTTNWSKKTTEKSKDQATRTQHNSAREAIEFPV